MAARFSTFQQKNEGNGKGPVSLDIRRGGDLLKSELIQSWDIWWGGRTFNRSEEMEKYCVLNIFFLSFFRRVGDSNSSAQFYFRRGF